MATIGGAPHRISQKYCVIVVLVVAIFLMAVPAMADTIYGNLDVYPNFLCPGGNVPLESLYPPGTFSDVVKAELIGPSPEGEIIVTGPGEYTFNGLKIEAIYVCDPEEPDECEWKYFNWTSSTPIGAVLVKSATCYWVYEYFPGATHGELLHSPGNAPIKEISHAEFGFLSIPEFPLLVCGMLGIMGVLGMVYYQKSRKE